MTKEEVGEVLAAIEKHDGDNEVQHAIEDALYEKFVAWVSTLDIPAAEVAKEVLKTKDMDFSRWYA